MTVSKAIVSAAKILISAIEAESPETDCRLLPRKIQELVSSSMTAQTSSLVQVTASEIAPNLSLAADYLACAHSMYVVGDKTNALRMVMAAFDQPDCVQLMTALSELNEETDPSNLDVVVSRINKGEEDDDDTVPFDDDEVLYGDNVIPPGHVDPEDAHNDALVGNPAAGVDAIQDQDLNNPDSGAPYGGFSEYDYLNQATPPDSIQVLRNVLSSEYDDSELDLDEVLAENLINTDDSLGDENYDLPTLNSDSGYTDNYKFPSANDDVTASEEDVVPGYDDNQLSNVRTDPATDVEWNPAKIGRAHV